MNILRPIISFFKDPWVIGVFIFFIVISIISNVFFNSKQRDIDDNLRVTIGVVEDYYYRGSKNGGSYYIEYSYKVPYLVKNTVRVSDKKLFLNEATKQFNYRDFKKITGAKFKVEYSSKNPENSRIIVGNKVFI
jgi:hypothetical protein